MDLFSTASHFSFRSLNNSPASAGDDSSEEEALTWSKENLRDSERCFKEVEKAGMDKRGGGREGRAEQHGVLAAVVGNRQGMKTAVAAMEVAVAVAICELNWLFVIPFDS